MKYYSSLNALLVSIMIILVLMSLNVIGQNHAKAVKKNTTLSVECWRMVEVALQSENDYVDPFNDVEITAVFVGPDGVQIKRPAFWDGKKTWKVRFSPTKKGKWEMKTNCNFKNDKGLNNIMRTFYVRNYEGVLDIYKHGFLRISDNHRYLTYDDGLPFFYLGDTHWCFVHERFINSNVSGIPSQFCYIVDKRVNQGFTVYQSEAIQKPHGGVHSREDEEKYYDLSDGVSESDLAGFRNLDRKFKYIADKGLVHANSQLFWVMEPVVDSISYSNDYMYKLGRYWSARYGAYPVLWTVAQEVDKDFNGKLDEVALNKWKSMADGLIENDDYQHPLSAHMLNVVNTDATNSWWGNLWYHSWWGVQWKGEMIDVEAPKKFWYNVPTKPGILYESSYENFATDAIGAVKAGYIAFQSGLYGYGYGANGIWNDLYSDVGPDCGTSYKLPERYLNWYDGANLKGASLLKFLRNFYKDNMWWKLVPRFDDIDWGEFDDAQHTALSTKDSDHFVVLFFGNGVKTGTLKKLKRGDTYSFKWFNPLTGKYSIPRSFIAKSSQYKMPDKPNSGIWLLVVKNIN